MALGSGFMIELRPWTFGSHGFGSSDPEASGSGPPDQRHCAASSPIALCAFLSVSLFFWSLFCFLLSEDDSSSSEISLRRCVALRLVLITWPDSAWAYYYRLGPWRKRTSIGPTQVENGLIQVYYNLVTLFFYFYYVRDNRIPDLTFNEFNLYFSSSMHSFMYLVSTF